MMVTDSIAELLAINWERNRKMSAFIARKTLPDVDIILLKSKLAMNISGKSVGKAGKLTANNLRISAQYMLKVPELLLCVQCFQSETSSTAFN